MSGPTTTILTPTVAMTELAYRLLRAAFTVAPIAFGLDKFVGSMAEWPHYLAPWLDALIPGTATQAMYGIGVFEIAAGVLVAMAPRRGSLVVAAWLGVIIVNLLTMGHFYDQALRDFGLLVGALALFLLAEGKHLAAQ